MNQTFLLVALFSVILASHYAFGGGLSKEAKTRRQSCEDLVKPIDESGSNEGNGNCGGDDDGNGGGYVVTNVTGVTDVMTTETSLYSETTETSGSTDGGSGYNCTLIIYFYEISSSLTKVQYELWVEWIQKIEITILADSSLSYEQKILQISYSLQSFFEVNIDIKAELSYVSLGSWGTVTDFIYVGYEISIEYSEEIITIDSSDSCTLFEALRNATSKDSEKSAAVEVLIKQILKITSTSSWSYTQQQAKIYLLFEEFFSEHSDWVSFFYSIEIEGYGYFQYYYDATFWYHQTTTISVVMEGSTTECVLLVALEETYKNTSLSITVRNQIKQLYEKLVSEYKSVTTIQGRISYLSSQCYEFYSFLTYLSVYVDQIECGSWGTIYDLLFCSQICTNYGCGNIDYGPGTSAPGTESSTVTEEPTTVTEKPTTVTEKPTTVTKKPTTVTEEPTTVTKKPTTVTEEPTTVPAAECSARYSVCVIDSSNQTAFTKAVDEARLTWSASYRASFNSYYNRIKIAIWGSLSAELTVKYVVGNCTSFNANNPKKQELLFSTYIEEWKGTIGQFVEC